MKTRKLRDLAGITTIRLNLNPCNKSQEMYNFREATRVLAAYCLAPIPIAEAVPAVATGQVLMKARCTAGWVDADPAYWTVAATSLDGEGAVTIRMRKPTSGNPYGDPAARLNDVLCYLKDAAAVRWAVSDYMAPPVGTIDFWMLASGSIPAGWQIDNNLLTFMFEISTATSDQPAEWTGEGLADIQFMFDGGVGTGTATILLGDETAVMLAADASLFYTVDPHSGTVQTGVLSQLTGLAVLTTSADVPGITVQSESLETSTDATSDITTTSTDGSHYHDVNYTTIYIAQPSYTSWLKELWVVTDTRWDDHKHTVATTPHKHLLQSHIHTVSQPLHSHQFDNHAHTWTEDSDTHRHQYNVEHLVSGFHTHTQDPHGHTVSDYGHVHGAPDPLDPAVLPHQHLSGKPDRISVIPIERVV